MIWCNRIGWSVTFDDIIAQLTSCSGKKAPYLLAFLLAFWLQNNSDDHISGSCWLKWAFERFLAQESGCPLDTQTNLTTSPVLGDLRSHWPKSPVENLNRQTDRQVVENSLSLKRSQMEMWKPLNDSRAYNASQKYTINRIDHSRHKYMYNVLSTFIFRYFGQWVFNLGEG